MKNMLPDMSMLLDKDNKKDFNPLRTAITVGYNASQRRGPKNE